MQFTRWSSKIHLFSSLEEDNKSKVNWLIASLVQLFLFQGLLKLPVDTVVFLGKKLLLWLHSAVVPVLGMDFRNEKWYLFMPDQIVHEAFWDHESWNSTCTYIIIFLYIFNECITLAPGILHMALIMAVQNDQITHRAKHELFFPYPENSVRNRRKSNIIF